MTPRRRFVPVATNNSSTFIQFPTNSRQLILLLPSIRSRTNHSKTSFVSGTTDVHSGSSHSKSSNTRSSSLVSRDRSRQKVNPILNNSLLNYRKQQPKPFPTPMSTDISYTTPLSLSSKLFRTKCNDSPLRTEATPRLTDEIQSVASDPDTTPDEDENENENNEEVDGPYLDPSKYKYITQWLNEVEQARTHTDSSVKTKRHKNKFGQT